MLGELYARAGGVDTRRLHFPAVDFRSRNHGTHFYGGVQPAGLRDREISQARGRQRP